ncbi:heptaprenylglyceryl phosphate synthase [Aquibacillus koreensis]|uniref:Heptaprenylglyceryl phosphate synthase n=1 Tax=Aquibacillus koreensis TaxID=279446 RepID=A0A9X4AIR8_9BACI|nr:heptaprenylglyceryl phosphate synthase [Aquibacillus koreensis]MCT2536811.1 heptaprenylglyceryl phosphate synthase [Aquibacillus koreensis]MDC3421432.1 heptaprenylglyceryl phosphate synthase [Aquibacillus koreensis]
MYNMKEWKHVFKLDPDKDITDEQLEQVCESGTDAVIVGGTDNVTLDNVLQLLSRIRRYTVPCALEVSSMDSITPGFDFYYIPMVFNSRDKKWMMDIQHEAVKQFGDIIDWNEMFVEGYCIMNEEAKAYQFTDCYMPDEEDVIAYARMAEHMFQTPIFYLEYSGKYGDPALVQRVKRQLSNTQLFYGGGITSVEQAKEMSEHADVIVVGNSIYDDLNNALKTVDAVKGK